MIHSDIWSYNPSQAVMLSIAPQHPSPCGSNHHPSGLLPRLHKALSTGPDVHTFFSAQPAGPLAPAKLNVLCRCI